MSRSKPSTTRTARLETETMFAGFSGGESESARGTTFLADDAVFVVEEFLWLVRFKDRGTSTVILIPRLELML